MNTETQHQTKGEHSGLAEALAELEDAFDFGERYADWRVGDEGVFWAAVDAIHSLATDADLWHGHHAGAVRAAVTQAILDHRNGTNSFHSLVRGHWIYDQVRAHLAQHDTVGG